MLSCSSRYAAMQIARLIGKVHMTKPLRWPRRSTRIANVEHGAAAASPTGRDNGKGNDNIAGP